MRERFLKFLKRFFVVLGVLFLIQLILLCGIVITISAMDSFDLTPNDIKLAKVKIKEIKPVIDYVDKYYAENNKYPETVDVKIKKGEYKYKSTNEGGCYQIEFNYNNFQQTHGKCSTVSDNLNAISIFHSEIKNTHPELKK